MLGRDDSGSTYPRWLGGLGILVADGIRRDSIQDVRIDDHLRISQGRRGNHARQATPAILRPAGPPRHHPKRVKIRSRTEHAHHVGSAAAQPVTEHQSR